MLKTSHEFYDSLYCNNCGKRGHTYNQCSKPITSIGLIIITKEYNNFKFLIICRKDSLGYVEFLRGKYNVCNRKYIQNLIDEMTIEEKNNLLTGKFSKLWNELWGKFSHNRYRQEEKLSHDKFLKLQKGIIDIHTKKLFTIKELILGSLTSWNEPEWGFPKGRRNYQENDISCAMREFEEETGYKRKDFQIINNLKPFQEVFTGSNYKSYKHKYFLGYIENPVQHENFQKSEVSQMRWLTLEECLKKIRPYNLERIELINNINKVLHKYSLIS
jgi:8-oxo-dGTP pyrophosphatase MutT (NUDIX family)